MTSFYKFQKRKSILREIENVTAVRHNQNFIHNTNVRNTG